MPLRWATVITDDEMAEIRKVDKGVRFSNMTLKQQEAQFTSWELDD